MLDNHVKAWRHESWQRMCPAFTVPTHLHFAYFASFAVIDRLGHAVATREEEPRKTLNTRKVALQTRV
ncbi:hypothetical protein Q31a_52290 [Aureliella helgolandensis]|uniref:Uncharacterized protein n=1 Tax=Aureliella helgolandensis TaxID=2527968 RepID=A0A518GE67_9BACT|nr:hypothetical protein Q31a_52290 [Aureliella helgolandensis]